LGAVGRHCAAHTHLLTHCTALLQPVDVLSSGDPARPWGGCLAARARPPTPPAPKPAQTAQPGRRQRLPASRAPPQQWQQQQQHWAIASQQSPNIVLIAACSKAWSLLERRTHRALTTTACGSGQAATTALQPNLHAHLHSQTRYVRALHHRASGFTKCRRRRGWRGSADVVRSAPRVAVGGQRDSPAHVAAPLQEARDGAQRRATESTGKGGGVGARHLLYGCLCRILVADPTQKCLLTGSS